MMVDKRRSSILQLAEREGFVSLQQLVDAVGASASTIRRDLDHLHRLGQVRRTHGGAAYCGDAIADFESRLEEATGEKAAVAAAAADLIEDGDSVLLDGGTTTLEVARRLRGKSLQVVTNSLPIAQLLRNESGIELLLVGGYVYPKTGVALGVYAVETLRSVKTRWLIMSVGGVTSEGLFNSNALLVETEQQMLQAAEEVIVVSDSRKLGRPALSHLCELQRVDRLVVDAGITDEWREQLSRAGVKLTVADRPTEQQGER